MLVLSIITWALSGLLAALFLMAGLAKVRSPHNSTKPMPTLLDYTPGQVRWIGIVEILGAIGIILPALLGILPWLTVVSALGLALIQFLAIFAHRKHNEAFTMNIIVMVVALAVAVLRIAGV